eukprot:PhF_6_TR31753/c0_g1_i1/m.46748
MELQKEILRLCDLLDRPDEQHCFKLDPVVQYPEIEKHYTQVCPNRMWFDRIRKKAHDRQYTSCEEFINDFQLIISNCKLYNSDETNLYHIAAKKVEERSIPEFRKLREKFTVFPTPSASANPPPNSNTAGTTPQSNDNSKNRILRLRPSATNEKRERDDNLRSLDVPESIRTYLAKRERYFLDTETAGGVGVKEETTPTERGDKLVADVSVTEILDSFTEAVRNQNGITREDYEAYRHAAHTIKDAFNAALPKVLLYDRERLDFYAMVYKRGIHSVSEYQSWGDLFGVEHLLRLLHHLPAMIYGVSKDAMIVESFMPKIE